MLLQRMVLMLMQLASTVASVRPPTLEERPMTSTDAQLDTDKLMAFVYRAVDEVGATLNCALVVMGDRLGYYRHLAAHGPTTATELAAGTATGEPYAREWL